MRRRKHQVTFLSVYGGLLATAMGVLIILLLDRCGR